jgi:hypothetical protein
MAINRQAISDALFSLLLTAQPNSATWQAQSSQHFQLWSSNPAGAANQPLFYLTKLGETVTQSQRAYGQNKYVFHYEMWTYLQIPGQNDPTQNPYDIVNPMIDSIDNVISPPPPSDRQTLGGLVNMVEISGEIQIADGSEDGQAVLRIPIQVTLAKN